MKKIIIQLSLPIAFVSIIASSWFLFIEMSTVTAEDSQPLTMTTSTETVRLKPPARVAKGVYLTAYAAANPKKITEIITLLNNTELNTVVIDIKDYTGQVLYPSNIAAVQKLGTARPILKNLPELIKKFHAHNIYVIARQTVFQDPLLADKQPEWAIHDKAGKVWRDHLGLAWVDPTNVGVWEYNVAIAREAIELGFDEINFDYVRFPSDGDLSQVAYTNGDRPRHEVMRDFYGYISAELFGEPAWISLDLFGFVLERHDGMGIGQRLADTVQVVDYVSPMMYPSHYPKGHLKLPNPATAPGLVITNGLKEGAPYFTGTRAQLRPWLQAFHLGATYDASKIRAQIEAVEKYPNAGWLLWNASARYSTAGLKLTTSTE